MLSKEPNQPIFKSYNIPKSSSPYNTNNVDMENIIDEQIKNYQLQIKQQIEQLDQLQKLIVLQKNQQQLLDKILLERQQERANDIQINTDVNRFYKDEEQSSIGCQDILQEFEIIKQNFDKYYNNRHQILENKQQQNDMRNINKSINKISNTGIHRQNKQSKVNQYQQLSLTQTNIDILYKQKQRNKQLNNLLQQQHYESYHKNNTKLQRKLKTYQILNKINNQQIDNKAYNVKYKAIRQSIHREKNRCNKIKQFINQQKQNIKIMQYKPTNLYIL